MASQLPYKAKLKKNNIIMQNYYLHENNATSIPELCCTEEEYEVKYHNYE